MAGTDGVAGTAGGRRRVVLVTGLSGGGKASTLRVLEDLGYEAVDNPPLRFMEDLVLRGERAMAVGVDARSRGFDAQDVLAALSRLRRNPVLRAELVFVHAEESVLLRRFTETRRRHPLAPTSRVADGIAAEMELTARLRDAADMLVDTTELSLPMLRRLVEDRFSGSTGEAAGMTVSLISFAYPAGLPREAELVFDARFLRNPFYDPILREQTGLDPEVAAFIEADPDFWPFVDKVTDLSSLLLPRFVSEGKKYASVAIGCTGGRHRSVHVVQVLADRLRHLAPHGPASPERAGWRVGVTHRELLRGGQVDPSVRRAAEPPSETGRHPAGQDETARHPAGQAETARHPAGQGETGAGGLTVIP